MHICSFILKQALNNAASSCCSVIVLWMLVVGCGCSHMAGRPDRPKYFADVTKIDTALHFETIEQLYNSPAPESDKRGHRDQYIRDALRVYDAKYEEFLDDLVNARKGLNAGADITSIALDTASVLATPASTKSLLAGLSAITTGSKIAIDKAYFYDQTLPAIVQQMEANRQAILAKIEEGLTQPSDQYKLDDALRDLRLYYNAGTIDGALIAIQQQAAKTKQDADSQIKTIRSNNEPVAQRYRGSIQVWLDGAKLTEDQRTANREALGRSAHARFGIAPEDVLLWLQGASVSELKHLTTLLQVPLLSQADIDTYNEEKFKSELDALRLAREGRESRETEVRTWLDTNFDAGKQKLSDHWSSLDVEQQGEVSWVTHERLAKNAELKQLLNLDLRRPDDPSSLNVAHLMEVLPESAMAKDALAFLLASEAKFDPSDGESDSSPDPVEEPDPAATEPDTQPEEPTTAPAGDDTHP